MHMTDTNVLRNDEIAGQSAGKKLCRNAPSTDGVYFKVPKVIAAVPKGEQRLLS